MIVLDYALNTASAAVAGIPHFLGPCAFKTVQTAAGVAASALSILTAGIFPRVNRVADYTEEAGLILPYAHAYAAGLVNPSVSADFDLEMGMLREYATPIFNRAIKASYKKSFFEKHVVSRGAYFLGTLVAVVADVADLALGLLAAAFSIVPCFGRNKKLNYFAMQQLTALRVIDDVCYGLRAIVNPQQFVFRQ